MWVMCWPWLLALHCPPCCPASTDHPHYNQPDKLTQTVQDIREHVTDEHLLQFAASIGEEAAVAAAAQLALPTAWEHSGCLLGAADGGAAGCSEERWEQVGTPLHH